MPSIASGAMSFSYIQNYFADSNIPWGFGVNPIGLEEYYSGGTYMPSAPNSGMPASGQISASSFYSRWGYRAFSATLTVGTGQFGSKGNEQTCYGYCSAVNHNYTQGVGFGNLTTTTYTTPGGTVIIRGFYWNSSINQLYIILEGNSQGDNDNGFRGMIGYSTTTRTCLRTSRSSTSTNLSCRAWVYNSLSLQTSGSFTLDVFYLG